MATVNFQCGNCNKLMAVGAEHLGQQVRCPHCQAVVVAPAAADPAPAPAPAAPPPSPFSTPTVNEQEDIFSPPEPSDDLFGRPDAPRIELPPPTQPLPPPIALDGPAEPFGSTVTFAAPPAPDPAGDATVPSWMDSHGAAAPAGSPPAEETGPAHEEALPQLIRKPRDSGGWFIGLVFIPLLSYSVLVTILAGYLFYRLSQATTTPAPPPSPLETLPAFDPNDEQHSTHLKLLGPRTQNTASGIDKNVAVAPLPPNQVVRLGKKLVLGDLEIEPLRVDREVVAVMVPGIQDEKPEPCAYPSLVLTLRLHNVSDNVVFQPLDARFNRYWDRKSEPPLTILELLGKDPPDRLFGGPAEYRKPVDSQPNSDWVIRHDDWVDLPKKGDVIDHTNDCLEPGDAKEFFVCTDGGKTKEDKKAREAADVIDNHHGPLLWRVHLRRGLEIVNEHRYVPVSTVIGVEFTDEDYRKSS